MENKIRIKWFNELDSTSSELLRHLGEYDNLSAVAAESQTAGRGQRGNRWISSPGENLTFSLFLKPEALPAREVMAVSCLASLAVRNSLVEYGVDTVIKWPNDIYAGNRKICGILIENGFSEGTVAWSVIGIGVNLNQTDFPGELVNPTSVKRLTGKDVDAHTFLDTLCVFLESLLPCLDSPEGRDKLRNDYAQDLFQKDRVATYRDLVSGEVFTGIILGITPEGFVRIKAGDSERTFGFKEVGYIL